MKGKFITFEGCEGVGKSRQIGLLSDYLTKSSINFILTREPGGSKVAEDIRKVILDKDNGAMTAECEALLYAAARCQHATEIIIPALESGKTVLCDRYIDSSFAYQGKARGLGYDFIEKINSFAMERVCPDATIFLDLDPVTAFARKGGADINDRVEQSGLDFHKKVYLGYKELAKKYPERIIDIDCSGTKSETHAKIIFALKSHKLI